MFFSHSGFSLARQLPLNSAKNLNRKNPSPKCVFFFFFFTPPVFHSFFANVNACSPLAGFSRVFGHVVHDLRNALWSEAARSCACTHLPKNGMRCGFFGACTFLAKKLEKFFWQCKWYLILIFANVNGPTVDIQAVLEHLLKTPHSLTPSVCCGVCGMLD